MLVQADSITLKIEIPTNTFNTGTLKQAPFDILKKCAHVIHVSNLYEEMISLF